MTNALYVNILAMMRLSKKRHCEQKWYHQTIDNDGTTSLRGTKQSRIQVPRHCEVLSAFCKPLAGFKTAARV
ncbi:MAG: hypothetical protein LBD53_11225 [Tannerella sp.]|nr:hypothetical protein [Tannerella sp.]